MSANSEVLLPFGISSNDNLRSVHGLADLGRNVSVGSYTGKVVSRSYAAVARQHAGALTTVVFGRHGGRSLRRRDDGAVRTPFTRKHPRERRRARPSNVDVERSMSAKSEVPQRALSLFRDQFKRQTARRSWPRRST